MSWNWTRESLAKLANELGRLGLDSGGEPPAVVPIGDGHSNLTFRVDAGQSAVVLRRPPPPPLPQGSHDMLREARIQAALGTTHFPVPEIVGTGAANTLFDVPYYVMSLVDGEIITSEMPPRFNSPERRRQIGLELIGVLAELHRVDWQGVGLADLGRPEGFNARHVKRIAGILTDEDRATYPEFGRLQEWLEKSCPPESGAALIHNDFRIGNVMWSREDRPQIAAVLDWELATIGDPMLDLAYTLASLPRSGQCRQPVQDLAAACIGEGFPEQDEMLEHYFELSGANPVNIEWHLSMVNWKLAVLYSYSRRKGMDSYYQSDSHISRFLVESHYHADMACAL